MTEAEQLKAEIARLRACFDRAVDTYPQTCPMPAQVRQWWTDWYEGYLAANREAS